MVLKYRSITGTNDILPPDTSMWQYLETEARKLFSIFGYQEIRTPILESTELFIRSVGPDTDIVEKEMYTFVDKDNKSTSLRPEETAGVIRAYLQNSLYAKRSLWKLYYIGPMFRRERPQAGRFRQFHQIGAEIIGSCMVSADAETLIWLRDYFRALKVSSVILKLSSAGCSKCRPGYSMRLREKLSVYIKDMCPDCQRRYKRNIFRVLDCKQPQCRKIIEGLPIILDFLCFECKEYFEELKKHLAQEDISYEIAPHLVRGLDYYTRTVYEFVHQTTGGQVHQTTGGGVHEGLGSQNAIAAGGRYDLLVQDMGGQPTGAVGFSIGIERLILALKDVSIPEERLEVYLVSLDKESYNLNFVLLGKLRKRGIRTDIDFEKKSLKAQMRTANKLGVRYVVVRGSDELKEGVVTLKDMDKGTEEKVAEGEIIEVLRRYMK